MKETNPEKLKELRHQAYLNKKVWDKIQRLVSVTNKGVNLINTKSLIDTLIDLHNYAAMAIMLIDENKDDIKKN
jgi:hypothetical protein